MGFNDYRHWVGELVVETPTTENPDAKYGVNIYGDYWSANYDDPIEPGQVFKCDYYEPAEFRQGMVIDFYP